MAYTTLYRHFIRSKGVNVSFQNVKQITVLCRDSANENFSNDAGWSARRAVHAAIRSVLWHAGVWEEYTKLFNTNAGVFFFEKKGFSLEPHIKKALQESAVQGRINATTLLYSVKDDMGRNTEERYDLTLVEDRLHWHKDSGRAVGGVGLAEFGAVVSYGYLKNLLQPVNGETYSHEGSRRFHLFVKMLTMHELGHMFGLWPDAPTNDTDENHKKAHCQNECVMYWADEEKMFEKIILNPFCQSCLVKLREFFRKP